MRSVKSEMLSAALALAVPAAVVCVLPYSALDFRAREAPAARPPFAAFVALDAEQEAKAMRRAKSAWQGAGAAAGAAIRPADLILDALPDDAPAPIVRIGDRARPPAPARVAFSPSPYLPTRAAKAPEQIPVEPEAEETGFGREEMLRLE